MLSIRVTAPGATASCIFATTWKHPFWSTLTPSMPLLLVGGLEHFLFFHNIWDNPSPIDFHIPHLPGEGC